MRHAFTRLTAVMVFSGALASVNFCVELGSGNRCFAQVPRTPPSRPTRPKPDPPTFAQPVPAATIRVAETLRVLQTTEADIEVTNLRAVPYSVTVGSTGPAPCGVGAIQNVNNYSRRNLIPVNGKLKLKWDLYFYLSAAGKSCPIYVYVTPTGEREYAKLDAGTVQIESTQTYKIENTWNVVTLGVSITGSLIDSSQGACGGLSAGLSGIIPIGLVKNGEDLSLHIRSGIYPTQCVFDPSPRFPLKRGWAVVDRTWKVEHERGDQDSCKVVFLSAGEPSGASFYVHAQMMCGVGPDNNNGVRATLQSVTLVGPLNQTYVQAFQ